MKRVFMFVLLACMALFVAACIEPAVESVPEEITGGETVFSATLVNPSTKAELNEDNTGLHVLWSSVDKISLIYGGKTNFFFSNNNSPAATTSFTGTLQQVDNPDDPYFYAIYPSHNASDKYEEGGYITPQLNQTQAYANAGTFSFKSHTDGGVGSGAIFVGRSDTHSISFYNVCSFLRFKITDNDDIIRVDLEGRNDEKICSSFKVGFNSDGTPDVTLTENTKKGPIKLSREGNLPFEKNQWYYITLLPTEFVNGAKITIYTETGSLVRTIGGPLNFNMNECRSIASIDAGKTIPDKVKKIIQLNGKSISSTTLWPHGTAALSLKLTGPLNNNVIPDSVTWSSDDENEAIVKVADGVVTGVANGNAVITATATYKDKTYSASCTVTVTEAPSQLVAKDFTVDDSGKKVNFAAGNLYTSDGGTTFGFNTYQGQIVSYDQPSWVTTGGRDKFSWNEWKNITSAEKDLTTDKYSLYKETQAFTDLSGWSMPTYPQWEYLLMSRKNSEGQDINRFAKATINGIPGLLLFPDEYVHPNGIAALANVNTKNASFSSNMFYGSDWVCMEDNGVVFLPSAGMTNETWSGNSYVYTNGYYWSSCLKVTSGEEGNPIRLRFYSGVDTYSVNGKNQYLSVRLVRFVTE